MLSDTLSNALHNLWVPKVIVGLVFLFCVSWVLYSRYFHPLSQYPGPFLASISRLWLVVDVATGHAEQTQRTLHQRYGPIVRIAPDEISIADPKALKTIYGIKSGFTKTDFYTPFTPQFCKYPDLFTNRDEEEHASRRKIVNGLYSMSNVTKSEAGIDKCIETYLSRMSRFAESGTSFDLSHWVQMYAIDVIGQLFFSRMFGFLDAGRDHLGYIRALDLLLPVLVTSCIMPSYIRPIFLIAGALVPQVFRAVKSLGEIEKAADDCIAERQKQVSAGSGNRSDLLSSLFSIVEEKGEKVDFGLTEIKVEVYVALFAGSDTTAAAMSSIFYHLLKNPSSYEALVQEIDEATAQGRLSCPHVTYSEATQLPYLTAVVKEGMRLHPSVALTVPRHVPGGGCEISGNYFPEGTKLGLNAWIIHRDQSTFGVDAEEYRPERWLSSDAINMDKYMFQFGGGGRTCISLCEMYKFIPEFLRSFHVKLAEPEKTWKTENFWFNKPRNVNVKVQRRK